MHAFHPHLLPGQAAEMRRMCTQALSNPYPPMLKPGAGWRWWATTVRQKWCAPTSRPAIPTMRISAPMHRLLTHTRAVSKAFKAAAAQAGR